MPRGIYEGNSKDLTGKTQGYLTFVRRVPSRIRGHGIHVTWECQCSCGASVILKSGSRSKSCGCRIGYVHGGTGTAEYRTWKAAKNRCFNKASTDYRYYGARGITMCDRWKDSFQAFLADVGPKQFPDLTLERINNDGNYEPENCKWATRVEQRANQRKPA